MLSFFGQAVRAYKTTGAIAPSGPVLARAMTRELESHVGPKRVLEVGPGDGAFTRRILELLNPGDVFHVVEINPRFARLIEEKRLAPFRARHPGIEVRLIVGAIQEVELEGQYDYVICGLPFNIFPLHVVSEIFRHMMAHVKEGGGLTYFEYLGMKAIKMPLLGRRGRKRLKRRIALCKLLDRRYQGTRDLVWRNLPPANAVHLRGRAA
ncbi:MAG: methyltransferase domain-containing protein [Phycisphaeraceae bacterium]|nr:methyltransferase domain-containing protein [Phycisphaerales bacterium]QOJ18170.1 MAG: methyltransferase domain-containing protein [Phycisphaeraceae bacterium]